MDSIKMVSDTHVVQAGSEFFSRIATPVSIGLDIFQGVTSTDSESAAFHYFDAAVDVGVSKAGYVGFGISVIWTLGGGAKGMSQIPYANPQFVFPY